MCCYKSGMSLSIGKQGCLSFSGRDDVQTYIWNQVACVRSNLEVALETFLWDF